MSHQHGCLDLALKRSDGATRPTRAFAQPPIQLSRVRYDDSLRPTTANFTLLQLGGILAGDQNQLDVVLHEGAHAQISAAAATQVYRMPDGSATQTIALNLASNSCLDWLGAPLILFGGANFTQTVRITLSQNARLCYLDVLAPGRLARGEAFEFARYEARFEVYNAAERCLVAERALLEPQRYALTAPGMFADTPVVGSLYVLGDSVDVERSTAKIRALAGDEVGVAVLPNQCGVLVRALGHTPSAVHQRLLRVWRAVADDSHDA